MPERPPIDDALLEESAEDLYENAPCGYLSTLPDGVIVKVNGTFLRWTGYAREEALGKRFAELLTVASRIFHETHYAPLLNMQGEVRELAFDLVTKDSKTLPVILNAVQRRDASGRPLMNRITVFDARDRRSYERELLHARRRAEMAAKSKAEALAMVSHEVRTPLSAIVSAIRLLELSSPAPQQARLLRTLKSSTEALVSLVNDVLDLSKLEAGKQPLEERAFDVRELAESVVQGLLPRAAEKGISVEARVADDVPSKLHGDSLRIRQVLTNLVGNAVKFTERGSVALSVSSAGDEEGARRIEFRVTDTGIGIAPERLERIFDEYTQESPETAARFGGTGLGLAISSKIVEMHGSRIHVASEPGKGSSFWFVLRLATQGPPDEPGRP